MDILIKVIISAGILALSMIVIFLLTFSIVIIRRLRQTEGIVVRCRNCNWQGKLADLAQAYSAKPTETWLVCPQCGNHMLGLKRHG